MRYAGPPERAALAFFGARDTSNVTATSTPFELRENEIELLAIRAQGAGGQNVNKVSNAIHLRFDIRASSLPGRDQAAIAGKARPAY